GDRDSTLDRDRPQPDQHDRGRISHRDRQRARGVVDGDALGLPANGQQLPGRMGARRRRGGGLGDRGQPPVPGRAADSEQRDSNHRNRNAGTTASTSSHRGPPRAQGRTSRSRPFSWWQALPPALPRNPYVSRTPASHGPCAAAWQGCMGIVPTVIVPVLNEASALPALLSALPAGYQAIVVDNGSTDGSADVAAHA